MSTPLPNLVLVEFLLDEHPVPLGYGAAMMKGAWDQTMLRLTWIGIPEPIKVSLIPGGSPGWGVSWVCAADDMRGPANMPALMRLFADQTRRPAKMETEVEGPLCWVWKKDRNGSHVMWDLKSGWIRRSIRVSPAPSAGRGPCVCALTWPVAEPAEVDALVQWGDEKGARLMHRRAPFSMRRHEDGLVFGIGAAAEKRLLSTSPERAIVVDLDDLKKRGTKLFAALAADADAQE